MHIRDFFKWENPAKLDLAEIKDKYFLLFSSPSSLSGLCVFLASFLLVHVLFGPSIFFLFVLCQFSFSPHFPGPSSIFP